LASPLSHKDLATHPRTQPMVAILDHIMDIQPLVAILAMLAILQIHIPVVAMGTTEGMLLEEVMQLRLLKTLQRKMLKMTMLNISSCALLLAFLLFL